MRMLLIEKIIGHFRAQEGICIFHATARFAGKGMTNGGSGSRRTMICTLLNCRLWQARKASCTLQNVCANERFASQPGCGWVQKYVPVRSQRTTMGKDSCPFGNPACMDASI